MAARVSASSMRSQPSAQLPAGSIAVGSRRHCSPEGANAVTDRVDGVDSLVNNVGGMGVRKPFEELDDADWLRVYDLNVMSAVRMTRHFMPAMRASNWGRLIFVASESGVQIPIEFPHYGVVKAGVIASRAGRGHRNRARLPFLPRDRHHGVSHERWRPRARATNGRARERAHNRTLRHRTTRSRSMSSSGLLSDL